jgi:small-conductance mechanosensitive channel/CRP-like cAMP-binding protein
MKTLTIPFLMLLAMIVIAIAWLAHRRARTGDGALRRLLAAMIALLALTACWMTAPRLSSTVGPAIAPYVGAISRAVATLWWLTLAFFAFTLLERFVWTSFARRGMQVPKLLIDIVRAVVFVFMALGLVSALFEQTITGLLAASGVFAVVMGFALQSTLADLFSGIAINLQRPYRVGDWIRVDDGAVGLVTEMNWRATQLRSPQGDTIVLPNSKLAAAQIVNFNMPTPRHRCEIPVAMNARVPPGAAIDVLERAALKASAVLRDPAPSVRIVSLEDWRIQYEIHFWVDGYADIDAVRHEVSHSIWYALDILGLGPWNENAETAAMGSRALRLVGYVDLFRDLEEATRARIADAMTARLVKPGEVIMREGESGDSVFIVELGAIDVTVAIAGRDAHTMARLGTGELFGEMSLLTGEPRSATLTALCETKVWELSRDAIQPILREEPAIADRLSRVMARRRLANAMLIGDLTQQERRDAEQQWPGDILSRIRMLFSLPG